MGASSQRRPGRSVRTMMKARMAPSGMAMALMPTATIRVFFVASQKSGSSKMKTKDSRLRLAVFMKKGPDSTLW